MSTAGPLVDRFGRVHTDLRISVTDRCNVRCTYCMPADGVPFRSHTEILSFEEIHRFVRVAAELGISQLRLTGGEPLVRKGIVGLVEMLAAVPGIEDLALTTNAVLLGRYAQALKDAGLNRLNISLDTLDRDKYQKICRRDELPNVLEGIAAADRAGFQNTKLNSVAIREQIEDDVVPLATFAREHGMQLRFIEFMPLDADRRWHSGTVITADEILAILADSFGPLEPVDSNGSDAPATEYRFVDGRGTVGVISSLTDPFCRRCSRLRLTADGKLRNCLFSTEEWSARKILRSDCSDRELADLIREAVSEKQLERGTESGRISRTNRTMHQIGG